MISNYVPFCRMLRGIYSRHNTTKYIKEVLWKKNYFLLRGPIFPCCLAFACPRVAAWLTDWLTGEREGNSNFSIQSESQRGSCPARTVSWSSYQSYAKTPQPLGYVKVVILKTFWKGDFNLGWINLLNNIPCELHSFWHAGMIWYSYLSPL